MRIKNTVKSFLHKFHDHKKTESDIYIFTLPRTGSTLLAEVLNTNPDSKLASEPFALNKNNREQLKKYFASSFLSERYVDLSAKELKRINNYFSDLSSGKSWNGFYWTDLFTKYHNLQTSRTLFKTHKFTYHFDDFMRHFKNDVGLYLLRHPISHSLSRCSLGWTDYVDVYLYSEKIQTMLPKISLREIEKIKANSIPLERMILSWCLENYVFIQSYQKDKLPSNVYPVFYEDLVLTPEETLKDVCLNIKMDFNSEMMDLMKVPSSGIVHSSKEAEKQIVNGDRSWMLNRWKIEQASVSEARLAEILALFEIKIYL